MDRRTFLRIGLGSLVGGSIAAPALAHRRRHVEVLERCGRLLLVTRVGSRGHRAFDRGVSLNVGGRTFARLAIDVPSHITVRLGNVVSRHDLRRLERNLDAVSERIDDLLDTGERRHFLAYWHEREPWDLIEARLHIQSCNACRHTWNHVIRGTGIDFLPLVFDDEVTVVAGPASPSPRRQLRLPAMPTSFRSSLSGKEIWMRVCVDRNGVAKVARVHSPGISRFVVQRAVDQVEGTPWQTATSLRGQPIRDTVEVVFRWA